MRTVLQRATKASVTVNEEIVGQIDEGLLIFLGIHTEDAEADADYLVEKMMHLRIFADTAGKMNLSLLDKKASVLVVSQFTLYANTRKGRRPSFIESAHPEIAIPLYEYFMNKCRQNQIPVANGIFGADMKVELLNDGPVTIILDSKDR